MWYLLLLSLVSPAWCGMTKHQLNPATISRSFVNLGKMEFSFYINGRENRNGKSKIMVKGEVNIPEPLLKTEYSPFSYQNLYYPKQEKTPCPCSSMRNLNAPSRNPSDILNKILSSNDLFTSNNFEKSKLCCDSHETQETIFIDLTDPREIARTGQEHASPVFNLPFSLEGFEPSLPKLPDVLFFPEKKIELPKVKIVKKPKKALIKAVGEKKVKNPKVNNVVKTTDKIKPSVNKNLELKDLLKTETPEVKTTSAGDTNAL